MEQRYQLFSKRNSNWHCREWEKEKYKERMIYKLKLKLGGENIAKYLTKLFYTLLTTPKNPPDLE
jgi:hypothetical protein